MTQDDEAKRVLVEHERLRREVAELRAQLREAQQTSASRRTDDKRGRRGKGEGRIYRPKYKDASSGAVKQSAQWWIQYQRNGQQVRESSGSTNRRVAVELLRTRLEDMRRGLPTGPEVERTTFDDLANMLEDDFVANGRRSLKRLRGALKHLRAAFDGFRALDLTEDQITRYTRRRLDEGAAHGTINRELTALKRAFRLASNAGRVRRVPHITLLAENNVRKGSFEPADFEAVMALLPEDVRPVVHVAYVTGWRVASEILTRQWQHVDFASGWLRLEPGETKNRQGRQFPLIPELRAVLEAQRARTDAVQQATGRIVPWIFHRNGDPIRAFRRSWAHACEQAGLAGRIPHDLRRSAVRNLERAGVPRSVAMSMVGHQTEAIYRRYAIADEAMLREGAEKLAALREATAKRPRRVAQFKGKPRA